MKVTIPRHRPPNPEFNGSGNIREWLPPANLTTIPTWFQGNNSILQVREIQNTNSFEEECVGKPKVKSGDKIKSLGH